MPTQLRAGKAVRAMLAAVLVTMVPMHAGAAQGERFVPERVFAGTSSGRGMLKLAWGQPRPFAVRSVGRMRADGVFRLDQDVTFEGKPLRSRHWLMRHDAAGRYAITLSDAAGPVTARIDGARLILRYPLERGGLVMHQVLDLLPDGRIANRGTVRFWGIPIGHLRETITPVH